MIIIVGIPVSTIWGCCFIFVTCYLPINVMSLEFTLTSLVVEQYILFLVILEKNSWVYFNILGSWAIYLVLSDIRKEFL